MIEYYIIFSILSFLAYKEIHKPKQLNAYSYIFLILLFSIFIGLRNEIGCDWDGYFENFSSVVIKSVCVLGATCMMSALRGGR